MYRELQRLKEKDSLLAKEKERFRALREQRRLARQSQQVLDRLQAYREKYQKETRRLEEKLRLSIQA